MMSSSLHWSKERIGPTQKYVGEKREASHTEELQVLHGILGPMAKCGLYTVALKEGTIIGKEQLCSGGS
jgi:hypothetical protein